MSKSELKWSELCYPVCLQQHFTWPKCTEVDCNVPCCPCSGVSPDGQRAAGSIGRRGLSLQTPCDGWSTGGAGLSGVLDAGSGAPPGEGGRDGPRWDTFDMNMTVMLVRAPLIKSDCLSFISAPVLVEVQVNGSGYASDIYRDLVAGFNILQGGTITVISRKCLLEPSEPNYSTCFILGEWSVKSGKISKKLSKFIYLVYLRIKHERENHWNTKWNEEKLGFLLRLIWISSLQAS